MKPKSLMLLGVSGTFGLIAAALLTKAVGSSNKPAEKDNFGNVVIASTDLEINTLLDEKNCRIEKWPINIIPPNAVRSLKEIKDKRTTIRVNQKAPISKRDLQNRHSAMGLPVPKGKTMYGITAPAEDHHSGLLQPGHLVNVIGIFKIEGASGYRSKTVVRHARVLAINSKTSVETGQSAKSNRGKITVSISVTQEQATLLALIARSGSLKLSIVGNRLDDEDDSDADEGKVFSIDDGGIISDNKQGTPAPGEGYPASTNPTAQNIASQAANYNQKPAAKTEAKTIRVISGGNVLVYEFKEGELPRLVSNNTDPSAEQNPLSNYADYGDQEGQADSSGFDNIPPDDRNLD